MKKWITSEPSRMKWIIAIIITALLCLYFFASNISGGVSDTPHVIQSSVFPQMDNHITFRLDAPASAVKNYGKDCLNTMLGTDWLCHGQSLSLSIAP